MIRFLYHICFIMMALATLLAGCSRAPRYDSRLVSADSLITVADQSRVALELLTSIAPASLDDEANRAYHSLLITQARYKCYTVITGDDEINTAVNYFYNSKSDPEKLTRAYLYKGAVMEELSKPDTAMLYYKQAEVSADNNDDLFNKGYALLRMGKLFVNHHAYDGRDIEKMEKALECFRKSGNTHYQIVCLKDLGALYRSTKPDKAEKTLNEAIALAQSVNDTANLIHSLNNLAYLYFMQGDKNKDYNRKAYRQLQRIQSLGINGLSYDVYTTFASVYANLGMPDSAEYFLQLANGDTQNNTLSNKTLYHEALSKIAIARGDMLNYFKYSHISDSTSFDERMDPDIVNIMYAELSFDNDYRAQQERDRLHRSYVITGIVSAVIIALLLLALLLYRRSHRYDRLIVELKDQSQSQMNDLTGLQESISEMKIKDEQLKGFISSHLGLMREMIETCYHEPNNRIAEAMKRIVKFQDSNHDNWVKLYDYIDMEHNNIMSHTRESYPQLDDRDLLLLALTCMRFSYIQTAIVMGYSNATSVSVLKQRLAKKMGLDCSLNDYIERYSVHDDK